MGIPQIDLDNRTPIVLEAEDDKVVLQDDDHYNNRVDVFDNNINVPQQTTINVEHSSDVVIGPVTQFHGPVTILQNTNTGTSEILNPRHVLSDNLNIAKVNTNLTQSDSNSSEKSESLKKQFTRNQKIFIGLSSLALLLIILVVSTVLSIKPGELDDSDNTIPGIVEIPNKLGSHKIIERDVWGGRLPLNFTRPLKHPTNYVIISHTAAVFCKTLSSCSESMRNIQSYHVSTIKSPDIGYNFLIGGDANIYVGRGWDIRNFHDDGCIGISFMGNFVYDHLTDDMIEATNFLLKQGIELGKISEHYQLVSHNQTYPTQSPGDNVYAVIKHWKHFKDGEYITWVV